MAPGAGQRHTRMPRAPSPSRSSPESPYHAFAGARRPVSPGDGGNGFGRRQASPGAVSGPRGMAWSKGPARTPGWWREPSWPLGGHGPRCPPRPASPRLPRLSSRVELGGEGVRSPAPVLPPSPTLGSHGPVGCEEVWKILGCGQRAQRPSTDALRPLGWSPGSCGGGAGGTLPEPGSGEEGGLSFPTRLRSGPDESLGVSAGTGATQDCPRHGPAPGQGRLAEGPGGQRAGARAHTCGHGRAAASPPGLEPRPRTASRLGPLDHLVVPAPGLGDSQGGGRRRAGWAWSCPGHCGLCVHHRGLPGGCPAEASASGGLSKSLPRTPNPARAPGAGSAPLMACGGVGHPSCSPSCPQDPAPCSSGGLGWGCQQQTLGRSGLCRHPGHADRHPGFTPRNARWVAQFLPARDPVCISLGHGGRCQGVLRCLAEAPPQACGDPPGVSPRGLHRRRQRGWGARNTGVRAPGWGGGPSRTSRLLPLEPQAAGAGLGWALRPSGQVAWCHGVGASHG